MPQLSDGRVRGLLLFEAATFVTAALVHAGILTQADPHRDAMIGESVIAAALLIGLAVSFTGRGSVARVALLAQGFALLGTLVGISTIIAGMGPRTVPDIAYHIAIAMVLVAGISATAGARAAGGRAAP